MATVTNTDDWVIEQDGLVIYRGIMVDVVAKIPSAVALVKPGTETKFVIKHTTTPIAKDAVATVLYEGPISGLATV